MQVQVQVQVRFPSLAALSERGRVGALMSLALVALIGIFLVDLYQPADIIFSLLYVAPITLTLCLGRPRVTLLMFVVTSVATIAAAAFGALPAYPAVALSNRMLAMIAQVLAATVVIQQLELRERHAARVIEQEDRLAQAFLAVGQAQARLAGLDGLVGAIPEGVLLLTANGIVKEANYAAVHLLGLDPEQPLGLSLAEIASRFTLLGADGRLLHSSVLDRRWPAAGPDLIEAEVVIESAHRDVLTHCMLSGAVIRTAGERVGAVIVLRDITSLRAVERRKDEFVSMATHELRSPLTTLRGYAQLAQTAASRAGATDLVPVADKMLRQVDQLNRLVADLLDVSRVQTGRIDLRPGDMDLIGLAHGAVEQQRALHPARLIEVQVDGTIPHLYADAQRLEQVFANLLDNAIKYSPDGGPILVRLWSTGQEVCATVADAGIGIPIDEQDRLFEQFYRSAASAKHFSGLGVGLYISHSIVQGHKGRMWTTSTPGEGSTFGFALPIPRIGVALAAPD